MSSIQVASLIANIYLRYQLLQVAVCLICLTLTWCANTTSTFTKKNVMLEPVSWDNDEGGGDAVCNVVEPQPCTLKWVNAPISRNGRQWPCLLFSLREPSPECGTDSLQTEFYAPATVSANDNAVWPIKPITDEMNLLRNLRTNSLRLNIKILRLSNSNN